MALRLSEWLGLAMLRLRVRHCHEDADMAPACPHALKRRMRTTQADAHEKPLGSRGQKPRSVVPAVQPTG